MVKRHVGSKTRTVSCITDPEFDVRLRVLAIKEGTSQAAIVRRALDAELKRNAAAIDAFFASGGRA